MLKVSRSTHGYKPILSSKFIFFYVTSCKRQRNARTNFKNVKATFRNFSFPFNYVIIITLVGTFAECVTSKTMDYKLVVIKVNSPRDMRI